jgi:hypothetical protein
MESELSPDAQAVWDAAWNNCPVQCGDIEGTRRSQVAAALRAAVQRTTFQDAWNDKFLSAEKILSIASELDGENCSDEQKPMVTNYRDIAIPGYLGESVADARKTAAKFRELEEKIKQLQKQLDAIEEYQQEQNELS